MKKIFALLMVTLFTSPLLAGGGNNVSSLNSHWGNASDLLCQSHAIKDFKNNVCLGESCVSANSPYSGAKEKVIQLWAAMKVTEGGAKFCPVRIDGRNKNKDSSWTTYHRYSANDDECIWLCKDGFGGPDCSETDGDYVCDVNKGWYAFVENYKKAPENAIGTNIEDSVAMFSFNKYKKCYGHAPEEHDRILMVTRWVQDTQKNDSGYPTYRGAFVRQMMVRAVREGWDPMNSWIAVYPATNSSEILVCMTGYKPSADNKNCVEINATRCAEQKLCENYKTGFDETIHTMKLKGNCYEYRCKEEGKAFASTTDRSCVDCPITLRSGPYSTNGTCLKCEQDKIYTGSGCKEAIRYSKTDLMYGSGKTRTDVPSLKLQCWTILDTDSYKKCVEHGADSNTDKGDVSGTVVSADKAEAQSLTATPNQKSLD